MSDPRAADRLAAKEIAPVERIKTNFPERYNAGPDAVLNPDDIAEVYWQIQQKRSAWTFEIGPQAMAGDVVT